MPPLSLPLSARPCLEQPQDSGIKIVEQSRADFLSLTEKRNLTAAFEACDSGKNGELRFSEFMQALAVMGKQVGASVRPRRLFSRSGRCGGRGGYSAASHTDNWLLGPDLSLSPSHGRCWLQVTKKEALRHFARMDTDGSGFITVSEWIKFYADKMQFEVDEDEVLQSFIGLWQQPTAGHPEETCLRYEGEEYITKEKLFEVMTKYGDRLTDEEAAEMIRECNPDEEGRIFFEKYRTMLIDTTTS